MLNGMSLCPCASAHLSVWRSMCFFLFYIRITVYEESLKWEIGYGINPSSDLSKLHLQLEALCLYLPPLHLHTYMHTHSLTHSLLSPSIHLLDMIVPLLLLYVLIHELWVKRQLHQAIDAAGRQSELWHGALLQIAIKVPFFPLEHGEQVESNGHS